MAKLINNKTLIKSSKNQTQLLKAFLEEIRLLREELALFLPQEKLEDFTNQKNIKTAYRRAIKQYPPLALWK